MTAHFNPTTHAAKAGVRMGGRWALRSQGLHPDRARGLSVPRGDIAAGIAVLQ